MKKENEKIKQQKKAIKTANKNLMELAKQIRSKSSEIAQLSAKQISVLTPPNAFSRLFEWENKFFGLFGELILI